MDLEYHPDCVYDRLVVRDGPLHISPILVYLCGQHQTSIYQSTSNAIFIEFHSDHIIPAAGFKMIIESGEKNRQLQFPSQLVLYSFIIHPI